jgi:hypothetical protein
MTGPDNREMPLIERGDFREFETLGDSYHGGIDNADRKIKIGLYELRSFVNMASVRSAQRQPPSLGDGCYGE